MELFFITASHFFINFTLRCHFLVLTFDEFFENFDVFLSHVDFDSANQSKLFILSFFCHDKIALLEHPLSLMLLLLLMVMIV
jgi:hypothetical protein